MQTARSQSQQGRQAHQKIDRYRLLLSVAVFLPYILFLAIFNAVMYHAGTLSHKLLINATLLLAVAVGMLVFSFMLVRGLLRDRIAQIKEIARARCLVSVVNVLSDYDLELRERMKRIARLLADEGGWEGWRCRIVLEDDPLIMPPSNPRLGMHVPMMAGDKTMGVLVVTAPSTGLNSVDRVFFDTLSHTLGTFVRKEKTWDNFHSEDRRRRASLLLHGEVENSVDNKL